MSFLNILDTLLLGPLKLVFEIIYVVANRFLNHPGLSIIVLSLIMNILVLPLYRRADAMQEQARDIDAKLRDGVAHIKKTFSGDERMMILQTYYRQNHYKPTDALNGSVSLLLEVPFFMAAYQFLSNLKMLDGVSLGPIADLAAPDGLITIGALSINLLPILMTAVNVVSSAIYLKGFPLKTKIQLYGMAAFFLVFLYTSPSGLVFYWTLNNVFSLVKTIFYKLKNPKKVLTILISAVGVKSGSARMNRLVSSMLLPDSRASSSS
jgi:YidC/Oxa1 family membrane protein insertase